MRLEKSLTYYKVKIPLKGLWLFNLLMHRWVKQGKKRFLINRLPLCFTFIASLFLCFFFVSSLLIVSYVLKSFPCCLTLKATHFLVTYLHSILGNICNNFLLSVFNSRLITISPYQKKHEFIAHT